MTAMQAIPEEQILGHLRAENPWWGKKKAIPERFAHHRPRPYLDLFLPLARDRSVRRAVVLMGPRRVGKTVLIHHTVGEILETGFDARRICYVSVDHPLYLGLSLEGFLDAWARATGTDVREEGGYVFFDEIQYLKNWENHLKALVDSYPALKCVVSGSAAAALRLASTESGAGRFTEFLLPPLTFYEFLVLLGESDLVDLESATDASGVLRRFPETDDLAALNELFVQYMNHGGYPEALFSEAIQRDPARYIKSDIIDKVLLRDLPSLYGINDIQELNYLFTTLAFNTAGEVSLEELTRNSGVAKNTLRRYLEYLEAAFLIRRVHRVSRTGKRFQRASFFKVYLTNPSMRSALFSPLTAEDPATGALVETALFAQWFHREERIFYSRWKGGEVDLVHLGPDLKVRWALEAKWSDRAVRRERELGNLVRLCHANHLSRAWVTTRTVRATHPIRSVLLEFLPASLYALAVGYNALAGRGPSESFSGLMPTATPTDS